MNAAGMGPMALGLQENGRVDMKPLDAIELAPLLSVEMALLDGRSTSERGEAAAVAMMG